MNRERFERFSASLPITPGIYGRENFFNSAVLISLLFVDNSCHLLFQKRSATIRQGREICFPGGQFDSELDSDFADTALRETEEELGLSRDRVRIVGRLDTVVTPRGMIVECFIGVLDIADLDDLRPDPCEVEEVFTIPLTWFIATKPEIYHNRVEIQPSYFDAEGQEHILLPVDTLGLPPCYKERRSEWTQEVVVYRHRRCTIWGLTAAIILGMVRKIR